MLHLLQKAIQSTRDAGLKDRGRVPDKAAKAPRTTQWAALGCLGVSAALTAIVSAGCRQAVPDQTIKLACAFSPNPPHLGPTQVRVTLTGQDNKPLTHASVNLEGDMAHAGMVPTFGKTSEVSEGVYQGSIDFTMAGDWDIIVDIFSPGGGSVQKVTRVRVVGGIEDPFSNNSRGAPNGRGSSGGHLPPTSGGSSSTIDQT